MTKSCKQTFKQIVPFKGKIFDLEVSFTPFSFSRVMADESQEIFKLLLPASISDQDKGSEIAKNVTNWLKSQARTYVQKFVVEQQALHGFNFNEIRIKDTRSRWGSCSSKNNLNFNWRLILAPEKVLNYVVVHETAHLLHLDHSENFWNTVSSRCPEYKSHKAWLKANGARILSWDLAPSFVTN